MRGSNWGQVTIQCMDDLLFPRRGGGGGEGGTRIKKGRGCLEEGGGCFRKITSIRGGKNVGDLHSGRKRGGGFAGKRKLTVKIHRKFKYIEAMGGQGG